MRHKIKSRAELDEAIARAKPAPVRTLLHVSEARLNDFCYMLLKKAYFEPAGFGSPRQADIRICMDLAATERLTLKSAILMPNERAGASHDVFYDVEPGEVFDRTIEYLEGHWIKGEFPESWKVDTRKAWLEEVVPILMEVPEEECGVDDLGDTEGPETPIV
jgi:hypothetical protein